MAKPEPQKPLSPLEILDQLMLHSVCGGASPRPYSDPQWILDHDNVFKARIELDPTYQRTHIDLLPVSSPPSMLLRNSSLFRVNGTQCVVIHISGDDPHIRDFVAQKMQPGHILEMQSESRYGLKRNEDYALFYSARPREKGWKNFVKNLRQGQTYDYDLIIDREAYRKLALDMLERMADPGNEKALWDRHHHPHNHRDHRYDESSFINRLVAVIHNADLQKEELAQILDGALGHNNYNFFAAFRRAEGEAFQNPRFVKTEDERRKAQGSDGPSLP